MPAPGASPRATSCSRTRDAGPQTSVEMVITRPSGVRDESFSDSSRVRAPFSSGSRTLPMQARVESPILRVTFAIATWNGEAFTP